MERVAVISDVHSNLSALNAVLEYCEREGVGRIYCAGDIIGYSASANEVVWELRRRRARCIKGNHERALFDPGMEEMMNDIASSSIRYTRGILTDENLSFLRALPDELREKEISLFHGSPFDPDEYVFEDMVDEHIAFAADSRCIVLGHTHLPFIRVFGGKTVINPGSVGQPRDGDPRASFALITDKVELRRVEYDIEAQIQENIRAGLRPEVSERLRWGV
jgi:putative phosphoesterase